VSEIKVKKWLQLFRAQTGFATVYTVVTPYMYLTKDLFLSFVLIPILLFLHYASFGHNSVMDYFHDLKDPHKQHHPLIAQKIKYETAHNVIHTMLIISSISLIMISLTSKKPVESLVALMMYLVFGHAYNDGLSKTTKHSWLPISLCFTSLFAYGWFLGGGEINIKFILLLIAVFMMIFYQIAFEGNLKDICHENNLLKNVAKKVECVIKNNKTFITYVGNKFSWARFVTFLNLVVVLSLDNMFYGLVTTGITFSIVMILITEMNEKLEEGVDRDLLLKYFGLIEAITFFMMLSLIAFDLIWLGIYLIWVLMGATYFVLMNRYLWETRWAPKV